MDAKAMHTHGTRLFTAPYGTAFPAGILPEGGGSGFDEVGNVISQNGVNMNTPATNVSHLTSPGKAAEKIPGRLEPGQNQFQINYSKTAIHDGAAGIQSLAPDGTEAGTPSVTGAASGVREWIVQYPDGGQWQFYGFISSYPTDSPDDNRGTIDVTIEITGRPVFIIAT